MKNNLSGQTKTESIHEVQESIEDPNYLNFIQKHEEIKGEEVSEFDSSEIEDYIEKENLDTEIKRLVIIIYNFLKSFITFVMGMSISEKQKSILIIFWGGFLFYSFVNGTFCAPVFYVLCIFLPTSLALINNKII